MSSLIVWICHSGQSIIAAKKSMQESTIKVKEFCKPHRHFSSRISQSELTKPLTSFSLRVISSKIHVLRLFEVDAHRVRPVCGLHFHERARNLLVVCPKWQRRQWYEWTTPNRRRHSPCWKLAFTSSPRRHVKGKKEKTHENSRICPHNLVFFLFSP